MKKSIVLALALAFGFATSALVGCGGQEAGKKTTTEVKTPEGTTTTTKEEKVEKTGDAPPPADGEAKTDPAPTEEKKDEAAK